MDFDYRAYSKAFIALHPFLQIKGYDPGELGYGPYSVSAGGKITGQAPTEMRLSRAKRVVPVDERVATTLERLMKSEAKTIPWSEVQSVCRLPGLSAIQRALFSIENATTVPEDVVALEKILRFCDSEHVFFPTSGHIQPAMERSIAAVFKAGGKTELIASNVFSRFSAEVSVDLLEADEPIGSRSRFSPELRHVCDVQVLKATSGEMAMLCDDGDFYTTVLTTDAVALDVSVYFEGFEWDLENFEIWWKRD